MGAMGADRGIHVLTDSATDTDIQPLAVAKILREVVNQEAPDAVLMGKQAIDDDSNCTGQMLAGLLGWPQATFCSEIEIQGGNALILREIDGGSERCSMPLPSIFTC